MQIVRNFVAFLSLFVHIVVVISDERLLDDPIELPSDALTRQCVFGTPSSNTTCQCDASFLGPRCDRPLCMKGGTAVRWTADGIRYVGCICKGYRHFVAHYYNGRFCENHYQVARHRLQCSADCKFSTLPTGECACNYRLSSAHCDRADSFSSAFYANCSTNGAFCNSRGVYSPNTNSCVCQFPFDGHECELSSVDDEEDNREQTSTFETRPPSRRTEPKISWTLPTTIGTPNEESQFTTSSRVKEIAIIVGVCVGISVIVVGIAVTCALPSGARCRRYSSTIELPTMEPNISVLQARGERAAMLVPEDHVIGRTLPLDAPPPYSFACDNAEQSLAVR